jgi:hypothetical protein
MRCFPFTKAVAGLALAVALATASSPALAGDTTTAETMFQEGLNAMKRDDFKAACDAFAGSNEADPSPGTQINLALCNEKQKKLASAWGWYRTAAGTADQRGQKDRAELARTEAARLEPKLAKLVIRMKVVPEGVTITRDGTSMPAATLGKEIPVDSGVYAIEVSAKGKKPFKSTVTVPASPGVILLDVTLEDAPPAVAGAPAPGDETKPKATSEGSTQRTAGYILGGAGILALVAAGGIEIFNLAVTSPDAKKLLDDKGVAGCDAPAKAALPPCATIVLAGSRRTGLIDSYNSKKDAVSTNELAAVVVGAGGVLLLGAGIALVLTAPSGKAAARTTPRVFPLLGQGTQGFGVSGSF